MKKIWQSYEIKGKTITNRIVYPPIATEKCLADGNITPSLFENYQQLSLSGIGTLIVEHAFIHEEGKFSPAQLSIATDEVIDDHKQIASIIKKEKIMSALQINHGGAHCLVSTGKPIVWGPSSIRRIPGNITVEPMSLQQIHQTVEYFQAAALRTVKAGYDMVEIHAAHGFLLSQFLSPLTNQRKDEYGGSLNNRMRLLMDIIDAVQPVIPEHVLLAVRLGIADAHPETKEPMGLLLEEGITIAQTLEAKGIDFLDLSAGMCGSRPQDCLQQGYFVPFAQAVKEAGIQLPLMITGGVQSLKKAQEIVDQGFADFVGIGRMLYQDPQWLKKEMEHVN